MPGDTGKSGGITKKPGTLPARVPDFNPLPDGPVIFPKTRPGGVEVRPTKEMESRLKDLLGWGDDHETKTPHDPTSAPDQPVAPSRTPSAKSEPKSDATLRDTQTPPSRQPSQSTATTSDNRADAKTPDHRPNHGGEAPKTKTGDFVPNSGGREPRIDVFIPSKPGNVTTDDLRRAGAELVEAFENRKPVNSTTRDGSSSGAGQDKAKPDVTTFESREGSFERFGASSASAPSDRPSAKTSLEDFSKQVTQEASQLRNGGGLSRENPVSEPAVLKNGGVASRNDPLAEPAILVIRVPARDRDLTPDKMINFIQQRAERAEATILRLDEKVRAAQMGGEQGPTYQPIERGDRGGFPRGDIQTRDGAVFSPVGHDGLGYHPDMPDFLPNDGVHVDVSMGGDKGAQGLPPSGSQVSVDDGVEAAPKGPLQEFLNKLSEAKVSGIQGANFVQALGAMLKEMPEQLSKAADKIMAQLSQLGALLALLTQKAGDGGPSQLGAMMGQLERVVAGLKAALGDALAQAAQTLNGRQLAFVNNALGGLPLAAFERGDANRGDGARGDASSRGDARQDPSSQGSRGGRDASANEPSVAAKGKASTGQDSRDGSGQDGSSGQQNRKAQGEASSSTTARHDRPLANLLAASDERSSVVLRLPAQGQATSSSLADRSSAAPERGASTGQDGSRTSLNASSSATAAVSQQGAVVPGQTTDAGRALGAQKQVLGQDGSNAQITSSQNSSTAASAQGQQGPVQQQDVAQQAVAQDIKLAEDTPVQQQRQPEAAQPQVQVQTELQQQQRPQENHKPSEVTDGVHFVVENDWLSKIARSYYPEVAQSVMQDGATPLWQATWLALADYNRLSNPDVLLIDQRLRLPSKAVLFDLLEDQINRGELSADYKPALRRVLNVKASA